MSNTDGVWDNAKKYISAGELGPIVQTHKNSVTDGTVGDPLKDTSGPFLTTTLSFWIAETFMVIPH